VTLVVILRGSEGYKTIIVILFVALRVTLLVILRESEGYNYI